MLVKHYVTETETGEHIPETWNTVPQYTTHDRNIKNASETLTMSLKQRLENTSLTHGTQCHNTLVKQRLENTH